MSNTDIIKDSIIYLEGKAADRITHMLKNFGGGNDATMVDGLKNIVNALIADKQRSVIQAGIVYGTCGIVCGVVIGGTIVWVHIKHKAKKLCDESEQIEVKVVDKEVELENNEPHIITTNSDVIKTEEQLKDEEVCNEEP